MPIHGLPMQGATRLLRTLGNFSKKLILNVRVRRCIEYHGWRRETHTIPANGPWKVLFFGTDEFSVKSLKTLYSKYRSKVIQKLEVVTVHNAKENAVVLYAKQHGIIINTWPLKHDVTDFHIGIVVSFGHLIPSYIINSFPLGMVNVHASLLPRWRGAAPIIYALMNGDILTGVTIMKIMPKKFDIGEIIVQKHVDIGPDETLPEVHSKLAEHGANLLGETFENLLESLQNEKPQNDQNVTYAPKVTSAISSVKWNEMSAKNVYDLQRALVGLYPLTTKFQNKTIKLFGVQQIETPTVAVECQQDPEGVVLFDRKLNALIVKCSGNSWISVEKLIIPGRKPASARDFRNGFLTGSNKTKVFFY